MYACFFVATTVAVDALGQLAPSTMSLYRPDLGEPVSMIQP